MTTTQELEIRFEDGMVFEFETKGKPYTQTGIWAVGMPNEPADDYFATYEEALEYYWAQTGY